ncbi:hypothetical protein RE474_13495 [Methanolobus sediminis]|uniref:Cache domain-containing protein n=1 Tax=Methanolobus sediminis TaxID=3072978 RepID=A0AA51YLM6_9EURY|nr:hypothetical protein [Methanolobus sediminis]WMW25077.1 hypothetical protein RE474_13495 [Methanolobus sediminis]
MLVHLISEQETSEELGLHATIKAENQAVEAADDIDQSLSIMMEVTTSIAEDLSSGEIKEDQVVQKINETLEEHPEFYGITVAYNPSVKHLMNDSGLYAPYVIREPNGLQLKQIEENYDYTQPDNKTGIRTIWYHQPMDKGPGWVEPHFGTTSKQILVVYALPFYNASVPETPAGIITGDYSLDCVRNIVGSLDLWNTGYGFIITEDGTIVSYPIEEYLGQNISDLTETDKTLEAIHKNMLIGVDNFTYSNDFTGQEFHVFFNNIPSTNWTMGVAFVEEEILQEEKIFQQHTSIKISMAFIAFVFFLSALIFHVETGSSRSLWAVAIILSILCLAGIGNIWYLNMSDKLTEENYDAKVFDRAGLEVTLNKVSNNTAASEDTIKVPTGIFLQSIEFSSSNNVAVTGYIWQKNNTEGIIPGVIFPESESTTIRTSIEKAYETEGVIGWYFETTLRQQFDNSKYPFDKENIWIRLWDKGFDDNVVLVPDLDSYDTLSPELKPGLEKDFVLGGWDIQKSYFSYRDNSYNTNFGLEDYNHQNRPELYFNVVVKRDFINPFVSYMSPLIVVALLIFADLLLISKKEGAASYYGFSSSGVLGHCAALLFVLIVAQVSLRDSLSTGGIIYLEYFYFAMYLAILAVAADSILFASKRKIKIIDYENNLIIKVLYWPVLTILLLIFTLYAFY